MAIRTIDDAKLTAVADATREMLHSAVQMSDEQMPELIRSIGIGVVPSYWQSLLASKATEINNALSAAGTNRSAFLWYTDAHWAVNYGSSPVMLKYLSKHTDMQKTFFGGDIAQEKTGEIDSLRNWQILVADIPNHHSVMGNHDNQVSELSTAAARAEFFFDPERTGDVARGTNATNGKMYYCIDNHIESTRYICLSTGRMWLYADEVSWCAEVLNNTPKNWHIVIISHIWLNYDYTNNVVITTPVDYTQGLLNMFDDYNYRSSGTESFTGTSYNFVNAQAKIEFIIGGHIHLDYDFTTAKGIPVILTECDGSGERDSATSATKGTTTENCVYAVIADYNTQKVSLINVGRGDSRSLTIPKVVTYTNWAKKAIGTDGNIYNGGMGYKENTRINSSNVETTATGWDVTGYIPMRIGDIVRFKNCSVLDITGANGTTSRTGFKFYDENFAFLNESDAYKPSNLPSAAWSAVYGDNGDIVQVTIPTSYKSATRYIRITMDDINENSIITVNEEID